MTDRVSAFTVVLADNIREDEVEEIVTALSMVRGVIDVTEHIVNPGYYIAETRIRSELKQKLWEIINE